MDKLKLIAENFAIRGITCYRVGGCIRNELMNIETDDFDICLVGADSSEQIGNIFPVLQQRGLIDSFIEETGNTFPVFITTIDGEKVDFALARTERKTGESHQEFVCRVKGVSIVEDLYRRDLTINAIAVNILTEEVIDPFNGRLDIKSSALHPVSDAFKEDELRVIRAARFASYFNFTPTQRLIQMCKSMSPTYISKERIGTELMKVMKYAKKPSLFFTFLRDVSWLEQVFPEVHALIDVPQNPKYHPEGDVFKHTMHCIDAVPVGDWFQRTTMLCHDFGKAVTTMIGDNKYETLRDHSAKYEFDYDYSTAKISAKGHEEAGVPIAKAMLERIVFTNKQTIKQICTLVELHMIRTVIEEKNHDKLVRRNLRRLQAVGLTYEHLMMTVYYDLSGRPPLKVSLNDLIKELYFNHARFLERNDMMKPIVTGDLLQEVGMKPGKEMGEVIKKALELQDRGTLTKDNWRERMSQAGFKFFTKEKL